MTREELLHLRRTVYEEYKKRVQLGEFDANADAIRLCLHSIVDLINHSLEIERKRKVITRTKRDVHGTA